MIKTPVKDILEAICIYGMKSRDVITILSKHFRRSIKFKNTMFIGHLDNPTMHRFEPGVRTSRIGTRLKQRDYETLVTLASALDVTPSRAAALLLDASIRHSDFVNSYFQQYLSKNIDHNRMIECRGLR